MLAAVIVTLLVVVGPRPNPVAVIVYTKTLPEGGAVTVPGLLLNREFSSSLLGFPYYSTTRVEKFA